jgi:lipopolysaccharide transport system permease protein
MKILVSLWSYRDFILTSILREFSSKYVNSLLGALWAIINPLAIIFVYTLVFSQVMTVGMVGASTPFSYGIYLCSGIFAWALFSQIAERSVGMFSQHAGLLKKVNFPRICLPVLAVAQAAVDFAIVFSLFVLGLAVTGRFPGLPILAVIPVLGVLVLFATGLGLILGILNVFFRDIEQVFRIVAQFWFWLTPVVYPMTVLPDEVAAIVRWNPLTPLMTALQGILSGGRWPDGASLVYPAIFALALCAAGIRLFRRHAGDIADEL